MIHVATVHWQTDRWIDIQLRYLGRFLDRPFATYAFLNDVPGEHEPKFTYASTEPIESHAEKLNQLAATIAKTAEPSDVILFLDGDAFPIAPLAPLVARRLGAHPLIAVQRAENNGDRQPHPCFCLTTVEFWQTIGGDWRAGYEWTDSSGRPVTDVGGNLLGLLDASGTDWHPLLRVNARNPYSLLFGIYGDDELGPIAYHHGLGFRRGVGARVDLAASGLDELARRPLSRIMYKLPTRGRAGAIKRRYHPVNVLTKRLSGRVAEESERMFVQIECDSDFWKALVETSDG